MAKINRLIAYLGLGLLSAAALTGCAGNDEAGNESSKLPEGTETVNPEDNEESKDLTILDAIDKNRPNFGDSFDYVSDYKPAELPNINKKLEVEIDPSLGLKFKDGALLNKVKYGTKITLDLFDISNLPSGVLPTNMVIRVANGTEITADFNSYEVFEDVTIVNLTYSVPEGFKVLDPGSEQNDRTPQTYGGLKRDPFKNSAALATPIRGGKDGYTHLGSIISYQGAMLKNQAFRVLTHVSNNPDILLGVEHQFQYNLENKGETEIHLLLHQVNSGTNIESKCEPVKIDLLPGESMSFIISAVFEKGGPNKNCMGYFIIQEDMNNMKLGISMSVKLGKNA